MNHEEQLGVVRRALELENLVARAEGTLKNVRRNKPKPPSRPARQVIEKKYPELTPQTKLFKPGCLVSIAALFLGFGGIWHWLMSDGDISGFIAIAGIVVVFLSLWWGFRYAITDYSREQEEDLERQRNDAAYLEQCRAIDRDVAQRQAEADRAYEEAVKDYNTNIFPKYEEKLAAWEELLSQAESTEALAKEEREKHYLETSLIPMMYRNRDVLKFVCEFMETSTDYDIKESIEMYERKEQSKREERAIEAQQDANWLANQQNALLDRQNEIAENTRRDQNISNAVAAWQRHKINKSLKDLNK